MTWYIHRMTKYTVSYTNGTGVFDILVEADTVDIKGEVVLFRRKVFGASPALDEDVVVAGFQIDRLISFVGTVVLVPAKTDVASEPADQVGRLSAKGREGTHMDIF